MLILLSLHSHSLQAIETFAKKENKKSITWIASMLTAVRAQMMDTNQPYRSQQHLDMNEQSSLKMSCNESFIRRRRVQILVGLNKCWQSESFKLVYIGGSSLCVQTSDFFIVFPLAIERHPSLLRRFGCSEEPHDGSRVAIDWFDVCPAH